MTPTDSNGCAVSGTTPTALQIYNDALAALLAWRTGVDAQLDTATLDAPGFVMAHVMKAWLRLGSRDPRVIASARPIVAGATGLAANDRERAHLGAIAAVLDDDYEGAKARLGALLQDHPRDVLALHMAHAFDHVTGDLANLLQRVAAVLPAWPRDLPGYHAVRAMQAFGLVEHGEYGAAEQAAREALALVPGDARAHHDMAHVFEMTDRPEAGARWLLRHRAAWDRTSVVATHCWWHLALFRFAQGHLQAALELCDERIHVERPSKLADLIDATALLWRIQLAGGDIGARWSELSRAWGAHIDNGYCSFTDLHAMLAFAGAEDWDRAEHLEANLVQAQALAGRYGESTRQLGLPVCRAVSAFARAEPMQTMTLLVGVPALAHRLGGSHAQRDVLHLTLLAAIEQVRRPRAQTLHRGPQARAGGPALSRAIAA